MKYCIYMYCPLLITKSSTFVEILQVFKKGCACIQSSFLNHIDNFFRKLHLIIYDLTAHRNLCAKGMKFLFERVIKGTGNQKNGPGAPVG